MAIVYLDRKSLLLIDFIEPRIENFSAKRAKIPGSEILCRRFEETIFAISKVFRTLR